MLFLNNISYGSESFAPPVPSKPEVARMCHWNMWRRRMMPFNEIADRMRIVLLESWPHGGRLLWEIEATDVIAEPYPSKRAAIRMISQAVGLSESEIRSHHYTKSHSDSGFLLAFRYEPVRRINLPRPKDLKFRQHGWLKEDDTVTLKRWGVTLK